MLRPRLVVVDVDVELANAAALQHIGEVEDRYVPKRRALGLRLRVPVEVDAVGSVTRCDRRLHHLRRRLEEVFVFVLHRFRCGYPGPVGGVNYRYPYSVVWIVRAPERSIVFTDNSWSI